LIISLKGNLLFLRGKIKSGCNILEPRKKFPLRYYHNLKGKSYQE
jgi:hypothetical protein